MVRVALAGCGRWGRNILRDLVSLGCEVHVADPSAEARSQAMAAGAAHVAESLSGMTEMGGVVIASPSATHAGVIEEALGFGVPIFVEKPMTVCPQAASSLAQRAPGRLFVMDKWRYHPGIEELARIARTQELGRPLGMHLRQSGWGSPHPDVDILWILLPHVLSIAIEVLGFLPPIQNSFVETWNGKAVTLVGTLGPEPWVTLEVSSRCPVKRREFRLHCEGGVAWLDDGWSDHIRIARVVGESGGDATDVEERTVSSELPLLRELRTFVDHLQGGPPPRSSAKEGSLVVRQISELRRLAGIA